MKALRYFKKGGRIYEELELDHYGRTDKITHEWVEDLYGPLPEGTIIEEYEEDTTEEGSKASKKNTLEETKRIEEETKGNRRR